MVAPSTSTGSSHCTFRMPPSPRAMDCAMSVPVARVHVLQAAVVQRRVDLGEVDVGALDGLLGVEQAHLGVPGLRDPVVAGGGEVVGSLGGDLVDGVREHGVGEERLLEVADVVDDDVGAALALLVSQRADVVGEVEQAAESRREAELAPGATSCAICSIARPSSVALSSPSRSSSTLTGWELRAVAMAGQVAGGDVLLLRGSSAGHRGRSWWQCRRSPTGHRW